MAVLIATLFTAQPSAISSSLKIGSKCSKISQVQKSGSYILICDFNKGKKVWRKATSAERSSYQKQEDAKATAARKNPFSDDKAAAAEATAAAEAAAAALRKTCVVGGVCNIGDAGPGGGTVFYDAGSQQSWGRYLEFAPKGWSGVGADPKSKWCNLEYSYLTGSVVDAALRATLGDEIGRGQANTNLMLANCTSGAAVTARAYKGGGKGDWFLPSRGDLNEMCKFVKTSDSLGSYFDVGKIYCWGDATTVRALRDGFADDHYWSSSEINATTAAHQNFRTGSSLFFGKYNTYYVRPVRAF